VARHRFKRQSVAAFLLLLVSQGCATEDLAPSAPSSLEAGQTAMVRGFQHEPAGYRRLMLNNANALPTAQGWSTAIDGVWHLNAYPPVSLVRDQTAPCSPPHAWSATYKTGLAAGSGPVTLVSQSGAKALESRYWYIRVCLKVGRAGNFENQASGTKMWFLTVGDAPATARCSIIPKIKGDAVQAIKSTWNASATFECSGVLPTVRFLQLNSVARPIKADVWQVHEWLVDAGDVNKANGRFRWWIDGQLVLDKRNHKFRTSKSGFYHGLSKWRWAPTWGGTTGVRTRADDYLIDDVYVSNSGRL
jgi:hypothetical protein